MADTTGGPRDWGLPLVDLGEDPWGSSPAPPPAAVVPTPPPAPPPRRSGVGLWGVALSALIGAATATVAVLTLSPGDGPVVTTVAPATAGLDLKPSATAVVAARVIPSIVTVEVGSDQDGSFAIVGSGSGVVLTADGVIVTNEHVIDDAELVRVLFPDGRSYSATVIGADELTDLAVLRVEVAGLVPIAIGSSLAMSVGDVAIAIGSPLGLEGGPSVTVGVVSAFDRRVRVSDDSELFGLLQTDAPITRGSSGGALVDDEGRLIGITSAIAVSDVGAEGLGFAIPVELVQRITADLIADGDLEHAFLGISGSTFFETRADGAVAPAGVEIAEILPGTAAEEAGLTTGDVIVAVDGEPVVTMEGLVVRLRYRQVGEVISVEIDRSGIALTIAVTLRPRPEGV